MGQGAFAIFEQGGFSASSFIVSVLLARWTSAPVFGAYAVAYTVFLILAGIHNAFLLEPMSVLGPARYGDRPHRYLQSQLRIHLKVTVPMALAVVASSFVIRWAEPGSPLAGAMLGMGLALPAILLIWTTRLAAYVLRKPPVALLQTLVYGGVTVVAMLVLKITHHVSGQTAFLVVGLAALIGSLPMWLVVRRGASAEAPQAPSPGRDHWIFGRWVAVAGVIGNLGSQCQGFLVVVILDLAAAGQLRAVLLVALPMAQVLNAVTTVALPRLSRLHGEGRDTELVRRCFLLGWCLIPIAVGFVIALAVFSGPLESLLYHGRYASVAWLFPVAGLQVVFNAMSVGPTLALRATEQPRVYLIGGSIQAVVTVAATFVLGILFGLPGVVLSAAVFYATGLAASYGLYRRWSRGNPLTFDFLPSPPTRSDRVSGTVLAVSRWSTALKRAGEGCGITLSRYPRRTSLEGDLSSLLRRADLVVDVGAHHGEYGRLVRKLGYRGPIASFEPAAQSYARLRQVTDGDPLWDAHRLALGSASAELTMSVFEGSYLNSLLPISAYGQQLFSERAREQSQEVVSVCRLDDMRSSLPGADRADCRFLLKSDAQGYDFEVLAGAAETLASVVALQIELSVKQLYEHQVPLPEALQRIGSMGFELVGVHPVAHDGDGLRLVDCDALFVKG